MTDRFIQWRTRKNNGVYEPEKRLAALILPLFLVPTGTIMYFSSPLNFEPRMILLGMK
jgi:hypothetical protein